MRSSSYLNEQKILQKLFKVIKNLTKNISKLSLQIKLNNSHINSHNYICNIVDWMLFWYLFSFFWVRGKWKLIIFFDAEFSAPKKSARTKILTEWKTAVTRIALVLHPISYLSALLWSLTSLHGTDKATMNIIFKRIFTKYEAWWLLIQASSGTCG